MKYLIVGLGNIGAEYAGTRHNIGFNVLDALAEASNAVFTTARYGDVAQVKHKGRTLILLKPSTYMNLSGKAVRYWMEAEKVAPENLLVVSDDIALPFGTLRLRPKGSAGGHNGLKNIAELLGTENFARMRFGVGGDFPKGHQVDYVLGEWSEEDRKAMPERLKVFCDAILSFATIGVERTMNFFNKKKPKTRIDACRHMKRETGPSCLHGKARFFVFVYSAGILSFSAVSPWKSRRAVWTRRMRRDFGGGAAGGWRNGRPAAFGRRLERRRIAVAGMSRPRSGVCAYSSS